MVLVLVVMLGWRGGGGGGGVGGGVRILTPLHRLSESQPKEREREKKKRKNAGAINPLRQQWQQSIQRINRISISHEPGSLSSLSLSSGWGE